MAGRTTDISGAHNGVAVNLASNTTLPSGCRGFQVGVAGDVVVDYRDGNTNITIPACVAGIPHAHMITKIYSTANGTTATSIVALF